MDREIGGRFFEGESDFNSISDKKLQVKSQTKNKFENN